jgi:hypothetical protein
MAKRPPNPFKVGDPVVNTRLHDSSYKISGEVVAIVREVLIEVRYGLVEHIPGKPIDRNPWPAGTIGRSHHSLWKHTDEA